MPKPEWGVKRTCPHCETRFYDLQKEPIVCPECGTTYDVDAHGKVSHTRERRAVAPAGADEEDLVDDEDLVKDEDADEDEDDALLGDEEEGEDAKAKGPTLSDEDTDEEEVPFKDPDLIDADEDEEDLEDDDDEDLDLDTIPDNDKD
ncbi:MAG TPA: TIGR02300 family protein [Paracoccaceae bacterium]|nr:TIGR02300 family protein [Paracoccaceae bacterium]